MIQSGRWFRLRREVLARHPACQRCLEEGIVTPATEVHHIRPVEDGVTRAEQVRLMYDIHNLRALCHDCHVQTHKELGRCGKKQVVRRNKEQVASIVRRFFGADAGGDSEGSR